MLDFRSPSVAFPPVSHNRLNRGIASGVDLRILPLGDSITWGWGSSDGNGYRLALATLITADGKDLEYIGRLKHGTMPNNENEGHSGFEIERIGLEGKPNYPERPNVVLLMAGTNDMKSYPDVVNAPKRLGTLIEEIVTACPDAAVLVATLTPLLVPEWNSMALDFNSAIPEVIGDFATAGKQVALVDMGKVNSSHIDTTDSVHPTDGGYALIAAAWYDGIVQAGEKGWIRPALPRLSQGQENNQDAQLPIVEHGSLISADVIFTSTWTRVQLMIRVLILVGLTFAGIKVIKVCLQRHKVSRDRGVDWHKS